MTATAALASDTLPPAPELGRLRVRLVEVALSVGAFGIGTGEFATMGLLPPIAHGLNVTEPQAGSMISAYALGVVVGAPILAVLGARMARRRLLIGLMGLFLLGNLLSALAFSFPALIVFRFLAGMPHGAYFGVASLVAASMAPADKRAQAVGRVMMGLTVATLLGTPIATWLGQALGWRSAFAAVGGVALLTALLIMALLPQDRPATTASPLRELSGLRNPQIWLTLGIAAVGCGGMFALFTFIAPLLTQVTRLPEASVPVVLCVFGVGMILGNVVGSRLADRALMPLVGGMLVYSALVLAAFAVTAPYPWLVTVNVLLLGGCFAIFPGLQTRLMDVAAESQTLAAALNHSAFNIANAVGAWLGGLAVAAGYGWVSTGLVGALLAMGGMVVFAASVLTDRRLRPLRLQAAVD